jgi:hypothetical protein
LRDAKGIEAISTEAGDGFASLAMTSLSRYPELTLK